MADLAALDELCVWMRSNGVTSARVGDLALTIGLPIAPSQPVEQAEAPPEVSLEDRERRDLATLLHSSGTDPEVFMTRRGRAA